MSATETDISTSKSGIRVLSLDGGDFRGLSPLIILRVLMQRVTVMENASATMRPSDYFHLIIGTGTGGLSALFLGRMRMTVDDAIKAYLRVGDKCFERSPVSLLQRLHSKETLFDGDSVTRVIGDIVQEFIGDRDAQLQDPHGAIGTGPDFCRTAVLATSSTGASAPPLVFRSYRTPIEPALMHAIHQVARASIAIAGAFPPVAIGFPPIQLIDAGVAGYNNPGEVALDEVTRFRPGEKINCLVSLGTGLQKIVRVGETSEDVMHVSRRLMEDCEKVHYQLLQRSHRDRLTYYRFNVTTGLDGAHIREWDEKTSGIITDITEGYARKLDIDASLTSCASVLTGNTAADSISPEGHVARALSLLNIIKDDALADKISTWLKAPDSSISYNDARKKHKEGSGAWFIEGEAFSRWKKDRASFLCVYGKPGCGKTVLCSSIITHVVNICQKKESSALAYFFFDGRDAQSTLQRHDGFIRSLIQQFADRSGGIPACLAQLYGSGHQQPPTDALEDVLQHIVRGLQDAYVVIDSLDECTERRELVSWINKVTSSTGGQLHLLSTSRPEREIVDNVKSPHTAPIFMEDETVKDIKAYIESKIQTDLNKWDEHNQNKIKDTLVKGANGMFRWVALQLDELRGCSSAHALEEQLRSLPDGLDETYERILLRINKRHRDDVKRFLTWIAFSRWTLGLEQLAEVVVVDFEAPNRPTYDPTRKYRDQKDVLIACSGLIANSHGTVKLAHFSVKEYLVSDRIANGAAKYFGINAKLSHCFIAETSLAYLLQFDSPEPLKHDNVDVFPLATYAATNWVFHLRAGGGDGAHTVQKLIVALFGSTCTLTNWIRLWDPDHPWKGFTGYIMSEAVAEPLYYASLLGLAGASQKLLEDGACINARGTSSTKHRNALLAACYEGHSDVVDLLVNWGVDINIQEGEYGYPLHTACYRGHSSIVKMLLEAGVDINMRGGEYGTALQAAAYKSRTDVVKLLLDRRAEINVGGEYGTALQAAARDGHMDVVKLLLDRGADINVGGEYGTALQAAAYNSHTDVVKLLLDRGADINVQGGVYSTALQAAAYNSHTDVVKLLLDRGANVNVQGGVYSTALQAAACYGHIGVIELLLDRGANVNVQGGVYSTVLQAAACNGRTGVVKLLLDRGAEINMQGGVYGTALQAAARDGHTDVVKLLLDRGAEINMQGGEYGTAFRAAALCGHTDVVELLLDRGADIKMQGGEYGTALQAAAYSSRMDVVELLLDREDPFRFR